MNLNELPWWKENYETNHLMNCDFFEYLNNKEVLERLNSFPLTKNLTISFLEKYVSGINLIKLTTSKFKGKIYRINPNNSLKEKASTLIHECIHGIYRVVGNGDDSTIEKRLCEYESSFYNKNEKFSKKLFKKYTKLKRN